jgi:predicted  nucleic acid-binding Zn-ribbon protein
MGPTNLALVKLYQADQKLRAAQERLDAATKNVRVQERKVNDLAEKLKLAQTTLRESQSKSGQFELDLKSRDAHIEKLRTQQQNAKNNKEYQAFLVEINTEKLDKGKVEEELIKQMEAVEKGQAEQKDLTALRESESAKLATMRTEINDRIKELQAEIDELKPSVEAAAAAVPPKAREAYQKLAERLDGEAMAAIAKPNRRAEEYVCTACNMDLVTDVYNKLHVRDDLVYCPSCRRILYIPDDLPPEVAVKAKPKRKEPKPESPEETPATEAAPESTAEAPSETESSAPEQSESEQSEQPATGTQ